MKLGMCGRWWGAASNLCEDRKKNKDLIIQNMNPTV